MEKKQVVAPKKRTLPFKPHFYEKTAWGNNRLTCGLDEVGRGCFAGPLVVSAVILPKNTRFSLLKDSKILPLNAREKAYEWIVHHALHATIFISPEEVDQRNIYQATLLGMQKAFLKLMHQTPEMITSLESVLVDAMPLTLPSAFSHYAIPVHHFNYGERLSKSVAAASIVAKVTRDRLMQKIDAYFPAFRFKDHKGYGTALHQEQLSLHGATLIHRKTFISNFIATNVDTENSLQLSLLKEINL